MKTTIILSLLILSTLARIPFYDHLTPLWEAWKYKHQKFYATEEEAIRFAIFADNHHKITKFNEENDTPRLAINDFADLTATEFKSLYSGCAHTDHSVKDYPEYIPIEDLPDSIDWRSRGAVTAVKNQQQCGSCWAFSSVASLESAHFINTGSLLSFSEQQLVDCDSDDDGCSDGEIITGIQYGEKYGLMLQKDYPYTAKDGKCNYSQNMVTYPASSVQYITPNSTDALKAALVNGPVSVMIESDQAIFQFYSSGVIKNCGARLDHAVLVVGYDKFGLYGEGWIIKNSWGTKWGISGYGYISTLSTPNNGQGVCGILSEPVQAFGAVSEK